MNIGKLDQRFDEGIVKRENIIPKTKLDLTLNLDKPKFALLNQREEAREYINNFLAKKIQEKEGSGDNSPLIICIAGGSASGKTSSVVKMIQELYEGKTSVISSDDYSRGTDWTNKQKAKGNNEINYDHIDYYDLNQLGLDIETLKKGQIANIPVFSFEKGGEPDGKRSFEPTPIIIVEGLYTLDSNVSRNADMKIFVTVSPMGAIIRRLARDIERMGGHWSMYDILNYMLETVFPMQERFLMKTASSADVILDNDRNPIEESSRNIIPEKNDIKNKIENLKFDEIANILYKLGWIQGDSYILNDKFFNKGNETIRVRSIGDKVRFTYKSPDLSENGEKRILSFGQRLTTDQKEKLIDGILTIADISKTQEKTRTSFSKGGITIYLDHEITIDGKKTPYKELEYEKGVLKHEDNKKIIETLLEQLNISN